MKDGEYCKIGDDNMKSGQKFFHDWENDVFYLVNYQEEKYMKIAEKGSQYYELCRHLYMGRWEHAIEYDNVTTRFLKVNTLKEMG